MITREQIRAARAWLNIGQQDVANGIGVSSQTISDIENERTNPKASILSDLQSFFEVKGIEFLSDGGVRQSKNFVKIYEGTDCYLRLLDDVHDTLKHSKEEWLLSASDERRCTKEVIEKTSAIRADGIHMRSLIKNGDTFLMGSSKEYRWMPDSLFAEGDVKIIYGDHVAYLVSWIETPKIIVIQDPMIAQENRRIFNFIWDISEQPNESTASIFYEQKK